MAITVCTLRILRHYMLRQKIRLSFAWHFEGRPVRMYFGSKQEKGRYLESG